MKAILLGRSLFDLIANFIDFCQTTIESLAKHKVGRFILGSIFSTIPISVYWGYAVFFQVDISLLKGIIGSLILMSAFGIAAVYGKLDQLIDGFNL